jgi:hypothetical protein
VSQTAFTVPEFSEICKRYYSKNRFRVSSKVLSEMCLVVYDTDFVVAESG